MHTFDGSSNLELKQLNGNEGIFVEYLAENKLIRRSNRKMTRVSRLLSNGNAFFETEKGLSEILVGKALGVISH